jgi:hypothetical protein
MFVEDYLWGKIPVNIVYSTYKLYPTLLKLLETFDFGINQIAYDGKSVIRTRAFDWDFKYGVFTLQYGKTWEKAKERHARISQRYQGWQFRWTEKALIEAYKVKFGINGEQAKEQV